MTELPPLIPPPGALPRITPRDRLNGTPAPGVTLGARAEALRGEHESAAAVKVQAMARGRNARKYQVQESSAAAKLQAVQRGLKPMINEVLRQGEAVRASPSVCGVDVYCRR